MEPPNQARPEVSAGRIRFAGLACLIGGLLWVVLVSVEELQASVPEIVTGLLIPLPMLLGMACGPLGLLMLRASGSGRMRRVGLIGTAITLLGICSYLAATLSKYIVGYEVEFFYPVGALLVGVGMLMLGIAVFVAKRLTGWHRVAPLFVGVYYVAMIPFQIIFFIIPNGNPSPILLGIWSITWILLGFAIRNSTSSVDR
ncbi:hypothetical protein [Neobacillus niacini]|uniref:hypothetical protein n=1 Tax=Neobacillus niacini TaxID=86668 RepID=UPI0021CB1F34|nr:hypothetical protein [Neobacillus niacini]MCM3763783.1 hypothetical protein [Neobacillus niacini]